LTHLPVIQFSLYLLALIQGFFDVLPIGGEAHRLVLPQLLGWPEPSPAAEFAVHVAILLALATWVWRDLGQIAIGVWHILRGRRSPRRRLPLLLLLALLPGLAAAITLSFYDRDWLTPTPTRIAAALLGFGLLLWAGDRLGMTVRRIEHLTIGHALIIGILLAGSLLPGAGRVATVIIACRWLGYERAHAARLAFILSLPVLLAGLFVRSVPLWQTHQTLLAREPALAGAAALAGAFLGLALLTAWIERRSFVPFALYRILAGAGLLASIYLV
jgi:undecaprenyl-diphosphatase